MLNRIIQSSLNNRVVVMVMAALILMLGTWTILRMDIDIFPDLNAPTVVVMTEAPGLAPEEVEKQVTYPIETSVNGATGVRRVRSSSTTGFSVVWVEFDWTTDVFRARQTVSERLANISGDLPPEAGSPMLGPQSSILGEIMIIGLTSTGDTSLEELRTMADRVIRPRLLSLGGVSQVAVIGGDVREYQILLDQNKMQHYGITIDNVLSATDRMNNNTSGGVLYDYGNEFLVKGVLNTSVVDDLKKAVVKADSDGAVITIGDIADIKIGASSPRLGVASERTVPAVLLTVNKQPSVGTLDLTEHIESELKNLSSTLPADVHVSTDIFRQSDFIDNSISNLQQALFEGALMVVVVLFFFLMNLRTTLISVVALPLSVIVTLVTLHLMGLNINTMSLGGIAIAIGSLVDDAIVDVENVYKRLRQNSQLPNEQKKSIYTVVFEASKEVRMPIFNSSLIIIASFLPLFFLSGVEGRMLIPLGISFIVALLASTIVALTVTPVLCFYLLGRKNASSKTMSADPWISRKLRGAYSRSLMWALVHKRGILVGVTMLFSIACGLFFTLGRSFLPSFNEGSFTINVSALPGISLEESDHIGREAEKLILSVPEINTVARKTGRAELDEHSLGVNVSEIEAPYTLSGRSRREVVAELREKLSMLPGVNVEIGQPITHRIDHMLSGTQAQIAIKIFGPDIDALYHYGSQIKSLITEIPGIEDVNVEQQIGRPELEIRPRRDMLARYGVSPREFGEFVAVAVGGTGVSLG
ncbi:MAG: efflux RND transporter permease subunit, partial [Muribaculum sp.]|nr:efflux RND transporter permease subunit [Muribaculum sp.]